jgi:apolipoprotein N-acyltransferase
MKSSDSTQPQPSPAATEKRGWAAMARAPAAIALSGVLIGLAATGVGHSPALAWLAFAPWLASLHGLRPGAAWWSGVAMGLAYAVPGRWSTFAAAVGTAGHDGWQQAALTVLLFLCYAVPFAVFGVLDALWRGRRGGAQAPAILRAGVLASLIGGLWAPFPFTPVAIVADATTMLQLGAFGGEPLLLFLLLWPSAALAGLMHSPRPPWRRAVELVPVAAVLLAVAAFGVWRLGALDRAEAAKSGMRVAALPLQLDLPSFVSPAMLIGDRRGSTTSALEITRAALARSPQCEIVVWPETPLPPDRSERACARAPDLAQSLGRPLLMQCFRRDAGQLQVTAEWSAPTGDARWHGKSSLVPFYEQPVFGAGRFARGEAGTVFALDDMRRLIPALCYELHARAHLRSAVFAGGNVIVHMASFTPFARHPIDTWDVAMSRLRAIEFGLPIVRAVNRGPAGWIDAAGRVRQTSARFGRGGDCIEVWSPAASPTVYAHISPFAAWLPGLLVLALTLRRTAPPTI